MLVNRHCVLYLNLEHAKEFESAIILRLTQISNGEISIETILVTTVIFFFFLDFAKNI